MLAQRQGLLFSIINIHTVVQRAGLAEQTTALVGDHALDSLQSPPRYTYTFIQRNAEQIWSGVYFWQLQHLTECMVRKRVLKKSACQVHVNQKVASNEKDGVPHTPPQRAVQDGVEWNFKKKKDI